MKFWLPSFSYQAILAPLNDAVAENGQTLGPFSLEGLAQAVADGRFRAETLVWCAGMSGWTAAGQLPHFASLFQTPPPPPPAPSNEE